MPSLQPAGRQRYEGAPGRYDTNKSKAPGKGRPALAEKRRSLVAGFGGAEEQAAVLRVTPAPTEFVGVFHTHTFGKPVEAASVGRRSGIVFLLEENHRLVDSKAITEETGETEDSQREAYAGEEHPSVVLFGAHVSARFHIIPDQKLL